MLLGHSSSSTSNTEVFTGIEPSATQFCTSVKGAESPFSLYELISLSITVQFWGTEKCRG